MTKKSIKRKHSESLENNTAKENEPPAKKPVERVNITSTKIPHVQTLIFVYYFLEMD